MSPRVRRQPSTATEEESEESPLNETEVSKPLTDVHHGGMNARNNFDEMCGLTNSLTVLLLCDADGAAVTPSRLGMLASDLQSPVMAKAAMETHLLETLEIVTPSSI